MKGSTKPMLLVIIVVCIVMALLISYHNYLRPKPLSGIASVEANEMMWVKCNDPNCGITYEMNKRAYFEYINKHSNPTRMETALPLCKKCGKASLERAIKCEKCGDVFVYGKESTDFPDKCPKCGYSKTLEMRNAAAGKN